MKTKLVIGIFVIALLIIVGLYAKKESANLRPKKETSTFKVGVILPLSGEYSFIGEDAKKSIELRRGADKSIDFVIEDSGFDMKKAISAYHKLNDIDKVDALINLDSVSFGALHPLIKQDKLLTLQLAESNAHENDTVLQIMPFSYPLFTKLAEQSSKLYEKVALVYGSADILVTDADYFRKGIDKSKIVYDQKIISESDFRTEVTKMLSTRPDAVTLLFTVEDGIKFLKTLKDLAGAKMPRLICDANTETSLGKYLETFDPAVFEGCISTSFPKMSTDEFITNFEKTVGHAPQPFANYAYDAVDIMYKVMKYPKQDWLENALKSDFRGASGQINFDENGTRLPQAELHIFKNGKFTNYE